MLFPAIPSPFSCLQFSCLLGSLCSCLQFSCRPFSGYPFPIFLSSIFLSSQFPIFLPFFLPPSTRVSAPLSSASVHPAPGDAAAGFATLAADDTPKSGKSRDRNKPIL